jgi:2-dehydropantoate 2-reductase
MRVLVVGAGAIGGYFGGRMLQAGSDITFLVRPRRAAELAAHGLVIKSPNGDVTLKDPPIVQADTLKDPFDVVLLSCKAYDLDDAMKSFAPAAGPQTSIVPLLNGMHHLDVLDARFGRERVLGGLCAIAVTLNEAREVVHLQPMQSRAVGARACHREHLRQRQVRSIGQRKHSAGDVGEMGFLGNASGLDLPDAHDARQHPGRARRQGFFARHF